MSEVSTDVCFCIGKSHKICQDYGVSGENYTIISDGCSAAKDSDFGSRLLVAATRVCILKEWSSQFDKYFTNTLLELANTYCRTLYLSQDALSATLLISKIEKDSFKVLCIGDGAVAAKRKDGSLLLHEYKFLSGAPYYLRYELDENIRGQYSTRFSPEVEEVIYNISKDGKLESKQTNKLECPVAGLFSFNLSFSIEEFDSVATFSDGVSSFVEQKITTTSKASYPVLIEEIVKELMNFKGYNKEFVHRRCTRALKNFCENNIFNLDDLSMGVIHLEQD